MISLTTVKRLTIQSLVVFGTLALSATTGLSQNIEPQENNEPPTPPLQLVNLPIVPLNSVWTISPPVPPLVNQEFPHSNQNFTLHYTTVPEPSSTLGLLVFGSVGVATVLKRKNKFTPLSCMAVPS
ncbi:PEP-CTERM sorting domain-containing protein [Nostoc sp. TCL26-01]|uniref:PEP-CTERM sorting domain-containing protein n=1 Tax=Nostoc sp. TCL26-01 TaxID=2576904 RepID=UPI0015BA379E|nr:PEP-CTERM sorting domain-containing protein [Nostoc sp. TCL26-01]